MSARGAKGTCEIEGCANDVSARGWCAKHYHRWRVHGDPTFLARLKNDPGAAVASERWVGAKRVYFTDDGRAFVITRRRRAGKYADARYYGAVFNCESCGEEAFSKATGATKFRFCGRKCAGKDMGLAKVGRAAGRTKPSAKNEKNYLDRLLSVLVRHAGSCVECGAVESLQCAHGFSRRYLNVRWDRRNVFCLCNRCHLRYTHRPLEWDEWLRARWGDELYAEIRALALRTDLKVDKDAVRLALADEIRAAGITVSRVPKSAWGWAGLAAEADAA